MMSHIDPTTSSKTKGNVMFNLLSAANNTNNAWSAAAAGACFWGSI
jgi:hypothetical protein